MKTIKNIFFLLIWMAPFCSHSQQDATLQNAQQLLSKSGENYFIENKGQWPAEVRYLARISGMNAWITNEGVVYDYYQAYRSFNTDALSGLSSVEKQEYISKNSRIKGQVVKMLAEGSNKSARSVASGKKVGHYNYFIGNDKNKWASNVNLYSELLIQDIYPGISIRYYFDNGLLRYDYIARPSADISMISLRMTGQDQYLINSNGELSINTSIGTIFHGKLYAYQQYGNSKVEVACSFTKNTDGTVGIYSSDYNQDLALVIDPLVYSTFIGNSDNDKGTYIATDVDGFAYITGYTESTGFPTVTGSYDLSLNGYTDIFVTKISTTGSGLEYSTFIGGNAMDASTFISVDTLGRAYIAGYSESTNYPATSLAYETVNKGGADAIVTVLGLTGGMLEYSTYIGGSNDDRGSSVAFDSAGNIYLSGFTESSNYPTTAAAYDQSHNGYADAFVSKFDPLYGYVLGYSTFIGGAGYDILTSMAIDNVGNVFITGNTESSTYPTKFGSYDRTYNGVTDAFVTKLDATGSNLVYSTFIGGTNFDFGTSITIDNSGNSYITGYTESSNYPVTAAAYDVSYNGNNDIFVTVLNSAGSALDYSTFVGGNNDDYAYNLFRSNNGKLYITGSTSSVNYPVTVGAYDLSYNTSGDVFASILNGSLSKLTYSSYLGGSDEDIGSAISTDNIGFVYLSGYTTSANYPATIGSYDTSHNLSYDVFVSKMLPINQSTSVTVSNVTASQAQCSWVKGDGYKRAVFVRQTDSGIAFPVNFTHYTANPTFGSGSQIGSSGWYCVYNDTGASVIIGGLSPNTSYRIMVFEYLGTSGNEIYNTDTFSSNPINFKTEFITPSIQAKDIAFSNVTDSSFSINWTAGNGSKRVIFVKSGTINSTVPQSHVTYIANTNYGSGTQISTSGWYCLYNDTGSYTAVSNLLSNTTYQVKAYEYNGTVGMEQYNTNTANGNPATQITSFSTPDTQAINITVSTKTNTSLNIKWTKGNGTKRTVFVMKGSTGLPLLINNTTYVAKDSFGRGTQIDTSGWFCVYNGSGNSVLIKNLVPNTYYRIFISEYNGNSGNEHYNIDSASGNPLNELTSYPTPDIQAKDIVFTEVYFNRFTVKWTNGNGTNRLVFITATNPNFPIPQNNTTYNANSSFGAGSQIGSTGWYCAYNGSGDSVNITALSPLTTYRLMVLEYNGTAGFEQYLLTTSVNNPSNQTSDYAKPDLQATNITFTTITPNNVIFDYTNGNGSSRLILITEGTTPYPPLVDNTTYTASQQIGTSGWYCKYNGSNKLTYISGLHPASWRMMICEYNGTAGSEKYNTDSATGNPKSFTNVGIDDEMMNKIHIYPNPSDGRFTIDNANGCEISVYDRLGQIVFSDIIKEKEYVLDLSAKSEDMYIIKLNYRNSIGYQKLIIKIK